MHRLTLDHLETLIQRQAVSLGFTEGGGSS